MAIPILSEILSFFQNLIQVMPKSVKYIIYLVFLFMFLSLIPFMLHMFGVHCDSQKNIRQTDAFSFYDNFQVSILSKDDLYNISNYKPVISANLFFIGNTESCSNLIKLDHSSFWGDFYEICDRNDTIINNSACSYVLRIGNKKGIFGSEPDCFQCSDYKTVTFLSTSTMLNDKYCFSNAYPINKTGCPKIELCDVPTGYYFNNQTGNFVCLDNSICGGNNTKMVYEIDVKLKELGAKRMYGNSDNQNDYKSVIRFKCYGNSLSPQLTVIGVPIFDYQIWLLLTILGAMFYFYVKYK